MAIRMSEIEEALAASPYWRKSGEGKYTARDYIFSVNLLYDLDMVQVRIEAFPLDSAVTQEVNEIRMEKAANGSWLRIGGVKIYLQWEES